MSDDWTGPCRFLSLAGASPSYARGDGNPRSNAEGRRGVARIRLPKDYGPVATARLRGESQARAAAQREDTLLCVRSRSFVVTTDSRHGLPVYPNLAREIQPTAINQLWVADITYIRSRAEFVYLAVVLDAYARRVIGWALGRTLEAHLAVETLRMALIERNPPPGLVHHSDRGVQYASLDYTAHAKQHQAIHQHEPQGNPHNNAACESFMKTLKYEEVYRNEYRDFQEAQAHLGEFLDRVYNQKRLHSALGYLPPAEFENGTLQ